MKIIKQDLGVYIDKEWCIVWFKNDKFHREDGPSAIWGNDFEYYYLNNCRYGKDEYWKEVHENY